MEEVFLSDFTSPFSGQESLLVRGREWVQYGNRRVVVESEWFRCVRTREEFTTDTQDERYLSNLKRALV